MSETRRADLAYPKSQTDDQGMFYLFQRCGGSGAGECGVVLGTTQFVYPIRVSKFVTFNRSLLLQNPYAFGNVEIYNDLGAGGLCDHNMGTLQPWYLAFSDNGVLTDQEVIDRGIYISDPEPPFDIEVDWSKLPQPVLTGGGVNPNWQNRIYVHIMWGNPGFLTRQSDPLEEGALKVVKHNQDIAP